MGVFEDDQSAGTEAYQSLFFADCGEKSKDARDKERVQAPLSSWNDKNLDKRYRKR